MGHALEIVRNLVRAGAIYEINGVLLLLYTLWEHIAALIVVAAGADLVRGAEQELRLWVTSAILLAFVAAAITAPPAPFILALMVAAGVLAVRLDRFSPHILRWRVTGGVILYALAALGYMGYRSYLAGVSAAAWAAALGGQGEAQTTLAQGQSFLSTLATWGLWLIIPLGYFSLLVQVFFAHPPSPGRADEIIAAVRTRGRR